MMTAHLLAAASESGVALGSVSFSYVWLANVFVVWGIFEAMRRASWWIALVSALVVITLFHIAHNIYPL